MLTGCRAFPATEEQTAPSPKTGPKIGGRPENILLKITRADRFNRTIAANRSASVIVTGFAQAVLETAKLP